MIGVNHAFRGQGETCECGEARARHRKPLTDDQKTRASALRQLRPRPPRMARSPKTEPAIIGIDGEGHDLPDGRHIYTLLCAVNERGELVGEVENARGLTTVECLEMLLALPADSKKFIFMGSYDWTKIIEDLHPVDIWYLMHPEARKVRVCKECKEPCLIDAVVCECGGKTRTVNRKRRIRKSADGASLAYDLDWFNGSFTVSRARYLKRRRETKVWDCFKFFQCSFVKAIEAWEIGTDEQRARILAMKSKRGSFADEHPDDIRAYCREECHLLACMMRKLINACGTAGIKLNRFDGAGSIASALLKAHGMRSYLGPPIEELPGELQTAIMSAYFGGRFENSVVGSVNRKVYNCDIHSAYPYALSLLPCLACGSWQRVKKDVLKKCRQGTLAVVHFRVREASESERAKIAWMPLPFRTTKGSICFPTGFSGWAWLPEFQAALSGWPEFVEPLEAWIYTTHCEHEPWAWMPDAYRKRCEWGKDGPGIVMKLGTNACAGKTMQNLGDPPPYKSWVWGGMTTATTRAQALDAIRLAKNRWSVLAVATDGIFTTEKITLPKPRNTGTFDLAKPLGAWGVQTHDNGVFFVKPGMYYDDGASLMRARGIGRLELGKNARALARKFANWDRRSPLTLRVISRRFYGARSSVLMYSHCDSCKTHWAGAGLCPSCRRVAARDVTWMQLADGGGPAYGRWAERRIDIEFDTFPKREHVRLGGTYGRLRVRDCSGGASTPYSPGETTPEGLQARAATDEGLEEPDWHDQD